MSDYLGPLITSVEDIKSAIRTRKRELLRNQ